MKITRFEHVAFTFEADASIIGLDFGAFVPTPTLAALAPPASMLVSHRHPDHFSIETLRHLGAPVAGPAELAPLVEALPFQSLRLGEAVNIAGFTVTATLADHGPLISAPVENFGYLIEYGHHRVWFTGDMAKPGAPPVGPLDIILLPVAGGGFVFGPEAAAAYLRQIGHRGKVVPIHDAGPAEPDCLARFSDLASGWCEVLTLSAGQTVDLSR